MSRAPATWVLALALSLASLAAPAAAKELEVKVSGGSGDIRLVVAPRDSVEAVLMLRFAGGYADEVGAPGGTRAAVHALLSMQKRLKYADLLQTFHGATPRFSASYAPHETVLVLRAHQDELMDAAEQLCSRVFAPAFDAKAYPAVLERSSVDGVTRLPLHDLLARLSLYTFPTDVRYRPEADAEQMEGLTWPAVKRHLEAVFTPANATVIATGGVRPAAVEALLSRHGGGARGSSRPARLATPVNHRFQAREEAHVFFFPLELDGPEKVAAARVLAELLEERVGQRLRRLPSAFPVEARAVASVTFKGVAVSMPDHPSAGQDLSVHVRQEAAAILEGRVQAEAFLSAREEAIRRLERVDARPRQLAEELLAGLEAPGWISPEVMAALRALDAAKLSALVGPSLAPDKSVHLFFSPEIAPSEATPMPEVTR